MIRMIAFLTFVVSVTGFTPYALAAKPIASSKKSKSGWLGVRLGVLDSSRESDTDAFVTIKHVFEHSPACKSGLKKGDIITEINGIKIRSVSQLASIVKSKPPKTTIEIRKVSASGIQGEIGVVLAERPNSKQLVRQRYLNQIAPPLDLISVVNGSKIRLSDYAGQVVLLDFWATWCGPCIRSMPRIKGIFNAYKDQGLTVIGVSRERPSKVKSFLKRRKINYPMALIPMGANNDYQISSYPTLMIIDQRGHIVDVHIGAGNLDSVEKTIQSLL